MRILIFISHIYSLTGEDDHYQDALEETLSSNMSSRSSNGGNTPARGRGFDDQDYLESEEEGIIDKLAHWWQEKFNTDSAPSGAGGAAAGAAPSSSAYGGRRGSVPLQYTPSPSGNITTSTTAVPNHPIAIVEADEGPPLAGCINLFTATQVIVAQRRFLSSIKPKAGSSFINRLRVTHTSDSSHLSPSESFYSSTSTTTIGNGSNRIAVEAAPAQSYSCEPCDTTSYFVRSKNYMKSKIKEPARECIYNLVGVDMYSFDTKLDHISQYIELPPAPKLGPGALALPENERLPPLLIINIQGPTYTPSMFGGNDGPGHSLVYYFALPEGWEPSMLENQAALGMAQRFFADGVEFDGQPTRDRLKLLPRIVNVDEWAVKAPLAGAEVRLLRNYNGKPLLTRPQHRFYSSSQGQYAEVVIDVHSFAYIARRAFSGFIPRLASAVFENAFVLQGNRAEELPEVVLAAVKVYHADFTKNRPFPAERMEETGTNDTGVDGGEG
jgi:Protein ENHANCED DISEASE RESISTANCE 2, C-terminal